MDICINGAGPVGAALACRLAASGWRVLIVDRAGLAEAEDPSLDGRAYAIAEGARRMLEDAGVWAHLGAVPQPIASIQVADGRPGERPSALGLTFGPDDRPAARQSGEAVPFGWMIEARDLRVALNAALRAHPSITIAAPDQARFVFGSEGVSVTLDSGGTHVVRLAVAAEGRRSPLREQAGIPVTRIPYDQCGLVAMIGHEKPHEGRALEQFLPQGPFARLPMRGTSAHPHRSAIVWAESEIRARRYYALSDTAFAAEIAERLRAEDMGAIAMAGRRWIYPLAAQYAHSYMADRLALVGDSAHGIHPIAGQGLNLGFRDVIALARVLGDATGQDPGSRAVLTRYQRATRPGNFAMLAATDGLERLFGNDNPVLRLGRDLGMAAVNRLPGLRRAFARRAMGL